MLDDCKDRSDIPNPEVIMVIHIMSYKIALFSNICVKKTPLTI